MCTDCQSYKLISLFIPRCFIKCFGLLLVTPVLSSTPFIFEGSPLICCLLSKKKKPKNPQHPKWTSLHIPQLKIITWMLVSQFPCFTMSHIKWNSWLRTLSTNLVLEAAGAPGLLRAYRYLSSPWQGDHPLKGRKMSFLSKIAPDTIVQCCPSCEHSACEEQARKQKEVPGDLVQHTLGWMCSTAHPAGCTSGLQCEAAAESIMERPPGRKQTIEESCCHGFFRLRHLASF